MEEIPGLEDNGGSLLRSDEDFYILLFTIIVIVVFLIILIVPTYNKLTKLKNQINYNFQKVKIEIDRKYSLLTNLLQTVREYAGKEQDIMTKVAEIREQTEQSNSVIDKLKNEEYLSRAFSKLKMTIEAYPDLKSNMNYMDLQKQLLKTENRLLSAKDECNIAITDYNNKVQTFPSVIFAKILRFKKQEYQDYGI